MANYSQLSNAVFSLPQYITKFRMFFQAVTRNKNNFLKQFLNNNATIFSKHEVFGADCCRHIFPVKCLEIPIATNMSLDLGLFSRFLFFLYIYIFVIRILCCLM